MENQEKRRTVQQSVSELVHLEKLRTEIEKKLQNQELRISNLETNIELMLTKNTIMQEISNTVNGNEEEVYEELRRIKEENEKTRKELEGHEIQIESNTINIEVQRYLLEEMEKKMKKKMNGCTVNEEVIKELIKEEITKKYFQKIKDEIEKNKKENSNPLDNNPIKEANNTVAKQQHNVPIISPIEIPFDTKYIKEIEEWTEKRINNILFDSDKDDWKINTSVFKQRVKNKENIIIIIEDEDGNKFGGYVNSKIDKVGNGYIYDSQSFVFSLESNGRMKGMMKFDIEEPERAFILYSQSDDCLFEFGIDDVIVYKEDNKILSRCNHYAFEYEGIENALCGKQQFTPKRFIVIEMK
ncbi:trichohyalin, putative [Entamoeba histolytica]